MGLDHVEYVYTAGMDAGTVEERLAASATGTLALAREGEAYAIPVAIHWDGERVLLRLGIEGDSEKVAFIEGTTTATLVCFDYEPDGDSWSVLVRGPLEKLGSPAETAYDEATINDAFPPLRVFDEAIDDVDPVMYALVPREVTGRRTVAE